MNDLDGFTTTAVKTRRPVTIIRAGSTILCGGISVRRISLENNAQHKATKNIFFTYKCTSLHDG
jgi:hypothetical protein